MTNSDDKEKNRLNTLSIEIPSINLISINLRVRTAQTFTSRTLLSISNGGFRGVTPRSSPWRLYNIIFGLHCVSRPAIIRNNGTESRPRPSFPRIVHPRAHSGLETVRSIRRTRVSTIESSTAFRTSRNY